MALWANAGTALGLTGEDLEQLAHQLEGAGLVEADAEPVGVDRAEVDPAGPGGPNETVRCAGGLDGDRVEERIRHGEAQLLQPGGQGGGETVDLSGDGGQPLRAVPRRIGGRDVGQQRLGGADVGGGLLPADVLLPGLEGQPVCRFAAAVDRHADEATGQ